MVLAACHPPPVPPPPSLMDHSASVAAFRLRSVTDSGAVAKTCQSQRQSQACKAKVSSPVSRGLLGSVAFQDARQAGHHCGSQHPAHEEEQPHPSLGGAVRYPGGILAQAHNRQ